MIKNKKILGFILFSIFFMLHNTYAQEFTLLDTPEKKELKAEKKYLEFQNNFFNALFHKAGEDYNKALTSLDLCKEIYPNDAGLNFEYAKNYLKLKDYDNAIFFSKKTLQVKPKNLTVLIHLKNAYRLQQDFDNAIKIQKEIITIKPAKENDLVYLYIKNRENDKAKKSYLKLEKLGLLDGRKTYFKRMLFNKQATTLVKNNKQKKVKIKTKSTVVTVLKSSKPVRTFKAQKKTATKDTNYKALITQLEKENSLKQYKKLAENSKEGLTYYPAQPKIYYFSGKAENNLKNYNLAVENLLLGLDFVIDNNDLLIKFYKQLKTAYLGLGQPTEATIYHNKTLALKN